jgi:hypothetical protein
MRTQSDWPRVDAHLEHHVRVHVHRVPYRRNPAGRLERAS